MTFPNRGRAYNPKAAARQRVLRKNTEIPTPGRHRLGGCRRLFVMEQRLSLFDECLHTFFLIVRGKKRLEQAPLEAQTLR